MSKVSCTVAAVPFKCLKVYYITCERPKSWFDESTRPSLWNHSTFPPPVHTAITVQRNATRQFGGGGGVGEDEMASLQGHLVDLTVTLTSKLATVLVWYLPVRPTNPPSPNTTQPVKYLPLSLSRPGRLLCCTVSVSLSRYINANDGRSTS